LDTRVEIEFVPGTGITTSTITVRGHIHGISNDDFQKLAKEAEEGCPVSKAMHGNVELRLHATLDAAH
jgi:osmotically inducible protein OsmC